MSGAVKLNSSGGGSVTLTPPSTASNLTVTLPSTSGTLLNTGATSFTFAGAGTISATTTLTLNGGAGSNGLVLDASNNVGIGAAPSYKFDIYSSAGSVPQFRVFNGSANAQTFNLIASNDGGTTVGVGVFGSTAGAVGMISAGSPIIGTSATELNIYANNASGVIKFATGGVSEKMRLDSSGNLGLGVTPSVPDAGKVFEVGFSGNGLWSRYQNEMYLSNNAKRDGATFKYSSTQAASAYMQYAGSHVFYTAASGTAGNAITFTQAMTLDASGNLVVGDTTATARLTAKTSTNDGSTLAIKAINSTGAELIRVLSNGYFVTGSASASPYNNTTASAANLYVDSGGLLYRSTSSARYKNSITNAAHGLAEVLKLRPVTYKGNNDGDTVFGGLIAEEVHDAGLTEFVQYNDDGEPDALAYGNMVSLAFKAIQELSAKNSELESRLAALEGK